MFTIKYVSVTIHAMKPHMKVNQTEKAFTRIISYKKHSDRTKRYSDNVCERNVHNPISNSFPMRKENHLRHGLVWAG